ncbi:glycosyltransferase family 4 protein [Maribacter sp. ANRC-HE7]|uniref:Glycosyltransferase family 4 protein n=1 Tax=Maribacter aquimaris TaxID=2737171 RepID=A0ABR7UZS4_9FLAO|nr:glycosyltransferase family 4 protein [Maribacter aquimaris]MBD0778094.1 glycosyltransferase family 4 protein [Maribacter aquimaris]
MAINHINNTRVRMKKVVYFGNKTSKFQSAKSTLETLEPLLSKIVHIRTYSDKVNKLFRLFDMLMGFLTNVRAADHIVIDVYSTKALIYAEMIGLLSRIFKKNYILVLHGGNLPAVFSQGKKAMKYLFNGALHIVAPSHYLKTFFETKGYTVQLIPNIIQLEQYPYLERAKVRPKILALRGFKKVYNALMTVKAIHILKKRGIPVELRLLGNTDEEHYNEVVTYVSEHNLQDCVTILPKQEKSVWIEESKDFDIMVSNPIIDNTPVSMLEGMALGMCVITTNVGGVPYLVTDHKEVLYVASNDATGLADKIQELITDEKLAHGLSQQGRLKAEEYDWNHVRGQWEKLLS